MVKPGCWHRHWRLCNNLDLSLAASDISQYLFQFGHCGFYRTWQVYPFFIFLQGCSIAITAAFHLHLIHVCNCTSLEHTELHISVSFPVSSHFLWYRDPMLLKNFWVVVEPRSCKPKILDKMIKLDELLEWWLGQWLD